MGISREKLFDLARAEVETRSEDKTLLSGFLIGSVVRGNPFLGGTSDVDLVLVHRDDIDRPREFLRLSHQVHFDILHLSQSYFDKPRHLRIDPWMGPAIAEPGFLYDPEHFFERVQASVRGQFHRPDFVLQRARGFIELASQHQSLLHISKRWQQHYFLAILCASNALLTCHRTPVSGRRWLADLRTNLIALDDMDTYNGILQLFGVLESTQWDFEALLSALAQSWERIQREKEAPQFSRCRKEYSLAGIRGLNEENENHAAAVLLLNSWEGISAGLKRFAAHSGTSNDWKELLARVQLTDADKKQRMDVLTRFLLHIEEQVIQWGKLAGA